MIQKPNETPIPANPSLGDNHVFGIRRCALERRRFQPCFGLVSILELCKWSELYEDEDEDSVLSKNDKLVFYTLLVTNR